MGVGWEGEMLVAAGDDDGCGSEACGGARERTLTEVSLSVTPCLSEPVSPREGLYSCIAATR